MNSLPPGYRALVIGSTGAIGSAFVRRIQADPRCATVVGLHRASLPPIDYARLDSIGAAAEALAQAAPGDGPEFHLILVATGVLQTATARPEKRLADLQAASLDELFRINTVGPALVLRHFAPLLDKRSGRLAVLSAKVGSIEDNRLGGWATYRASKAALNMLLKTAAIELSRTHPGAVLAALHPGTVRSALSRPFKGDTIGRDPDDAAAAMLAALEGVPVEDSGCFLAYDGARLPW